MTALTAVGAAMGAYLLLLARSAWKQGEFRKFIISLAVLVMVGAALAAITAVAVYMDGG